MRALRLLFELVNNSYTVGASEAMECALERPLLALGAAMEVWSWQELTWVASASDMMKEKAMGTEMARKLANLMA